MINILPKILAISAVFGCAVLLHPLPVLGQGAGLGTAGELVDPNILRVCADPSNMPFSD